MKTIIIFDQVIEEPIQFMVVNGDYAHLDGKYINSTATSEEDSALLNDLLYYPEGHELAWYPRRDRLLDKFPTEIIVNDPDTAVITVGFLP